MPSLVNSSQSTVNSLKKSANREPKTVNRRLWRHGVTLVELLVVVTLISILATIGSISYTASQKRARDAKRKADLDTVKKALEMSINNSTGSASYPACNPVEAWGGCMLTATDPPLTTYLNPLPQDPTGPSSYSYIPTPTNCTAGNCTAYTLLACLEFTSEPIGGNVIAFTSSTCTSGKAWEVKNP